MQIEAKAIGKKYKHQWIIKGFSHTFAQGKKYAITGHNGSGKTTLLKLLSGFTPIDKGQIIYTIKNQPIGIEKWHHHIGWAGPYTELIEEFTAVENFHFHSRFTDYSMDEETFFDKLALPAIRNKALKDFSSGMKQKFKLALLLFSEKGILLLDEPSSNLDRRNTDWYLELIGQQTDHRMIIIASNQPHEYSMCDEVVSISSSPL